MLLGWNAFWPSFSVALIGTLKVFAMGMAGFIFLRKGWFTLEAVQVLSRFVAYLTLPCLIFYRFALQFDPQEFPQWWKFALIGLGITVGGMVFGKFVALRNGNEDEAMMLVGFQNAGFFVLPMLQALLSPAEYSRASLMLFMIIVPFNAGLWFCGSWFLLHERKFDWKVILTPPFCATVGSLLVYGLFHKWTHGFNDTLPMRVLFGDATGNVGAVQLLGDLTVPLATVLLGASIAHSISGPLTNLTGKRAALETTFIKMIIYPFLGFLLLQWLAKHSTWIAFHDPIVQVLLILQFSAPPAITLSVFSQQNNYKMKFIPLTCLISYIICLVTVPFWVALVQR